jgi:DNA-binding transcriptional LysR family regulator
MAAVEAGHEITVLPSCVSGAAGQRLKLLKIRPVLPPWVIVALWREEAQSEIVRTFVTVALNASTERQGVNVSLRW